MYFNRWTILHPGHKKAMCSTTTVPLEAHWSFPPRQWVWKARDPALGRLFCQLSWAPGKYASSTGLQANVPARLGSRRNHLPAQADLPCKEKPIRSRAQIQTKSELRTKRNLPRHLENSKKDEFQGLVDTMPLLLLSLNAAGSSIQILSLPPNLLSNKNSTESIWKI